MTSIDEYIAKQPDGVQAILERIRAGIQRAAPAARETISYGMPAFALSGVLVYFAAFKHHIGVYPPVRGGSARFKKMLAPYAGPKGNLIFPLDEPIPYALITTIVKLRARQQRADEGAARGRTRHAKLRQRATPRAPAARKKHA
jgi:uncharacterized protein YdhG (YjbR/CyaY superfamily)